MPLVNEPEPIERPDWAYFSVPEQYQNLQRQKRRNQIILEMCAIAAGLLIVTGAFYFVNWIAPWTNR